MAAVERLAIVTILALIVAGAAVRAEDNPPAPVLDTTHPVHAGVTHPGPETPRPHPEAAHPLHEPGHPAHEALHPVRAEAERTCLNQKERRAEIESGKLIRLSVAMHEAKRRMPGAVVRARLCHGHDGLVYVLTVLAHDGKVARIAIDAMKGTVAGER